MSPKEIIDELAQLANILEVKKAVEDEARKQRIKDFETRKEEAKIREYAIKELKEMPKEQYEVDITFLGEIEDIVILQKQTWNGPDWDETTEDASEIGEIIMGYEGDNKYTLIIE